MDRNRTISEQFDSLYEEVLKLLNDEGIYATEEGKSVSQSSFHLNLDSNEHLCSTVRVLIIVAHYCLLYIFYSYRLESTGFNQVSKI